MPWKIAGLLLVAWLVLLTAQLRFEGRIHWLFVAVIAIGVVEIMRGRRPAG